MAARDANGGAAILELKTAFRDVNEEIEEVQEKLGGDRPEFLCECGRDDCGARISMTIEEYEGVRSRATRFAVKPGHEWPGFERVVESTDRYAVVETKRAELARVSIARDRRRTPRARRPGLRLAPSAA